MIFEKCVCGRGGAVRIEKREFGHRKEHKKVGALPIANGERGAKHSPPGNTMKFHENHEILKFPRNHPVASRIIRDHS